MGAEYIENEPVPVSGKEPKVFCNESSNQTRPLLSTAMPEAWVLEQVVQLAG